MAKPLVVVTGKNGQLGRELETLAASFTGFDFLFTGREELDLNNPDSIPAFFKEHRPAYVVNCAAYTAVDKAETERETAYAVNAVAAGNIAKACEELNAVYIGISTDYVFNGNGTSPYLTTADCDPVNYYGYSKYMGEQLARAFCSKSIIIRTSWVYSRHGNNFVKTMLRLMKERPEIRVVNDQLGSPTWAADIAAAIVQVIQQIEAGKAVYGIYHYTGKGVISWYDFALAIRDTAQLSCEVLPIPSSAYPTPAKRPAYSALDTAAFTKDYGILPKDWNTALQECIRQLS